VRDAGRERSILFGQEESRAAAVGLRDEPDPGAVREHIGGQNPPAALDRQFVLATIVLVHVAHADADRLPQSAAPEIIGEGGADIGLQRKPGDALER